MLASLGHGTEHHCEIDLLFQTGECFADERREPRCLCDQGADFRIELGSAFGQRADEHRGMRVVDERGDLLDVRVSVSRPGITARLPAAR